MKARSRLKGLAEKAVDTLLFENVPIDTAQLPAKSTRFATSTEFEKRVKRLISSRDILLAAKVHIISLSKLPERYGSKWPRIADDVDAIARKAIERHLTGQDLYTRFHDLDYLIVFNRHTKEEAQLKTTLIAREISKRLSGDETMMKDLVVRTAVGHVSGNVIFKDLGTGEVLSRQFEEAASSSQKDAAAGDVTPQPLQFLYRPLWYVRQRVLSTYLCLPVRALPSDRILTGYDTIQGAIHSTAIAELDLTTLRRVSADLSELLNSGRKLLLSCPVHVDTLTAHESRTDYQSLFRSIPESLRHFLVCELVWGSVRLSGVRLEEAAPTLTGLCRAVTARLPLSDGTLPNLRAAGLNAVGADLGARTDPEAPIIADMERFAEAANLQGLRTFVHGLDSLSLTTAAICAGFDYVGGDAITSVVDAPQGVHRFDLDDMFSRLAPEG